MNFEDLQKAWQCQNVCAKLNLNANADVLLKEVQRSHQQLRTMRFLGDVTQISILFLLVPFFAYHGLRHASWTPFRLPNWDFLLEAFVCAGVGTFILVYSIVQRRKRTTANDPLKACIEASLHELNHQIWLQWNVLWWFLLPLATVLAVSGVYASLLSQNPRWAVMGLFVFPLLCWGIYRLNQSSVRKSLEPRRQELEALLASLK